MYFYYDNDYSNEIAVQITNRLIIAKKSANRLIKFH